jgi:hypothetical protein
MRNGKRFEHTFETPMEMNISDDGVELRAVDGRRLFGFVGDVPYFGENLPERKHRQSSPVYFPKIFYKDRGGITRVAVENPPRSYKSLEDDHILDTQDVARRARCSPLTVLRHANAKRLKIHPKSSKHDFYYRKQDVEEWLKKVPQFQRGRPRKDE